jgi:hypothetical protein
MLVIVWTLPNTIFLRNLIMGIASLLALVLFIKKFIDHNLYKKIPFSLLGLFILWTLIHYIFFSIDQQLQLKEIKGLLVRSVMAILIASALIVYLKKEPQAISLFGLFVASTVFINIGVYCFYSYKNGVFLDFGMLFNKPFNKIETTFWGSILISYSIAILHYSNLSTKTYPKFNEKLWFCLIIISLFSSLISTSKSGMLIGCSLIFTFVILLIRKILVHKFFINLIWIFIFLIILFIFIYLHIITSIGWFTIFSDFMVAINIDLYPNSLNISKYGYPEEIYSGNIYERISWGFFGLNIILDHPFGYGLVNQSFESWINYLGGDYKVNRQTHIGWVDLGLAYGLPGLIILWSTILYTVINGFKQKSLLSLLGAWTSLVIFGLGFISEIIYKQFFEATLFWISFGAVAVFLSKTNVIKKI